MNKLTLFLCVICIKSSFTQNTILWRVSDTVHHKTSYMLGTYHQFGNSFVDSITEIQEFLQASDLVIFESLDDHGELTKTMNARQKTNIKRKFNKKYYHKLESVSKNWAVDFRKLSPLELRWKLYQEYNKYGCKTVLETDNWDHMDSYLEHLAIEKEIPVYGFETNSEQGKMIQEAYEYPNWNKEKRTIKYLLDLFEKDEPDSKECAFSEAYSSFDLSYRFDSTCSESILLKDRNNDWMLELPKLLREQNCFIAVGLFHLYYDCGLIQQLKSHNFVIEPVSLNSNE